MALLSLYTTYWISKMTTAKPQCYLQCFVVVCCIELCPDRLYIVYLSQIIHQWPQFGLNELRQFIINWSCLCKRKKWMKMKKKSHLTSKESQKRKVETKRLLSDQLSTTKQIKKKSLISKTCQSIWSFNIPPLGINDQNKQLKIIVTTVYIGKFMIDRYFHLVPYRQGKYV